MASAASNAAYDTIDRDAALWTFDSSAGRVGSGSRSSSSADLNAQPRASSSSSNAEGSSPRKPVSRSKKAVAACSGAIITSFLMTPFDVVKTRLQTQAPPQPLFLPSQHLGPPVKSAKAFGKQKAEEVHLSTSSGESNRSATLQRGQQPPNASCCKPTFFTDNVQAESKITCQYDPRLDKATSSFRAAAAATSSSSTSTSSSSSTASRWAATSKRYGNLHTYPHPLVDGKTTKLASTCAFPDRLVAQRVLLAGGTGFEASLPAAIASSGNANMPSLSWSGADAGTNVKGTRLTGLWDGVIQVGRLEGIRGLWRGLTPTLLMTVPSQVTYMTCYDFFRDHFLSWGPEADAASRISDAASNASTDSPAVNLSAITPQSLSASLAAGALARSISATLVTPLELLRTRLQASSALSSSDSLTGILRSLQRQVSQDGVTVLWRGLGSTLWRDVPFSALYFAGYEAMKRALTGGGLGEGHAKGHGEEFTVAFVSGATSGTLAAIATHPFDLVKTRLQAKSALSAQTNAPSSNCSTLQRQSATRTTRGTATIIRQIYTSEGIAGLFRGLSPRVAKVAPACGIMIASFEVVGRLLAED